MATVDDLVSLVAPPSVPVDGDGDWDAVEATLGLRLPADFMALLRRYGFGEFVDISLFTPFDAHTGGAYGLLDRAGDLLERYAKLRESSPGRYPFPLYPEPGGLLEWAIAGGETSLCWLTEGEPDGWPVAVWNPLTGGARHEMGAVELLHRYLSRRQRFPRLPRPPAVPWFEPYRERSVLTVQLGESKLPYRRQLRRLREVLAPTVDRGGVRSPRRRQEGFKVLHRDWLVTYESHYGRRLRVAFPPGDASAARAVISQAVPAMGARVLVALLDGSPISLGGGAPS